LTGSALLCIDTVILSSPTAITTATTDQHKTTALLTISHYTASINILYIILDACSAPKKSSLKRYSYSTLYYKVGFIGNWHATLEENKVIHTYVLILNTLITRSPLNGVQCIHAGVQKFKKIIQSPESGFMIHISPKM